VPGLSFFDPIRSSTRLVYAIVAGVIAWFATAPLELTWLTRLLVASDLAGLTMLVLVGRIILGTTSEQTRRRAATEDGGRAFVGIVVLVVSAFALFAATYVLHRAGTLGPRESTLAIVLALLTALGSWLLTHTSFTLRYAHLFYRGGVEDEGGIEFPHGTGAEPEDPDDLDFAYFAFTIGMCFQVSDSEISDRGIRRTALAHALLSFAYNTVIIALALSMLTSHVG
jgi:uncharacterized membrane protein